MELSFLQFVLSTLPSERQVFYYGEQDYAVLLLEHLVGDGQVHTSTIRQSSWAKLLDQPRIREGIGQWGDGWVNAERLHLLYSNTPLPFRITFSQWGDDKYDQYNYKQTSRTGYNLVLQLNFANDHNQQYTALRGNRKRNPFCYFDHPIRRAPDFTLAWARIDISDDFSEALIEELQTDWLRAAKDDICVEYRRQRDPKGVWQEHRHKYSAAGFDLEATERYVQQTLRPYQKLWAEALLSATLRMLWQEIGVQRVYYHTDRGGRMLKNCFPPRSLYTQLPKRFCFQESETDRPSFLKQSLRRLARKVRSPIGFWYLEM